MNIIDYEGGTISEPGCYRNIPIEVYHNDTKLLNGPSVSKSSIKHCAPPEGSPKRFWQNYAGNPLRIKQKAKKELVFGKAVHSAMLGDEVFEEKFVVMPDEVDGETYHARKKVWIRWFKEMDDEGLMVISKEQYEQIQRMAADAATHPLVTTGGLNGEVEISMFAKDPETGIWLKSRPDVLHPNSDGVYVDLKSAGKLDADFLERQLEEAGYYLQGAMTKRVCDLLGLPFNAFSFLYCLSADYADTDFRVLDNEEIALGEAVIQSSLKKIRHGLNTGEWPGVASYTRENIPMKMNKWARGRIIDALKQEGVYFA